MVVCFFCDRYRAPADAAMADDVHRAKLALKERKFDFERQLAEELRKDRNSQAEREINFRFLSLTVVVVLLVLCLYWLSARFGFGKGMPAPPPAAQPTGSEHFSPYASILSADSDRTDSSFDFHNNMPFKDIQSSQYSNIEFNDNAQAVDSETRLFGQVHDLVM
jgi:hypothetical protein